MNVSHGWRFNRIYKGESDMESVVVFACGIAAAMSAGWFVGSRQSSTHKQRATVAEEKAAELEANSVKVLPSSPRRWSGEDP